MVGNKKKEEQKSTFANALWTEEEEEEEEQPVVKYRQELTDPLLLLFVDNIQVEGWGGGMVKGFWVGW